MKRLAILTAAAACLLLAGCSAAAFWLSGCGSPEAGLVVVNDSGQDVYSIVLEYEDSTEAVQAANGSPLLKPGESCGLLLEEGADRVTVILSGRLDREIARTVVDFTGERRYLTLEEDRTLALSEEWPSGL